jgi:hypothetical protein
MTPEKTAGLTPVGMADIADGGLVPAKLIAGRNTNVTEYIWKVREVLRDGRRPH